MCFKSAVCENDVYATSGTLGHPRLKGLRLQIQVSTDVLNKNTASPETVARLGHLPCQDLRPGSKRQREFGVLLGSEWKVCCCSAEHPHIHSSLHGTHSLPVGLLKPVENWYLQSFDMFIELKLIKYNVKQDLNVGSIKFEDSTFFLM